MLVMPYHTRSLQSLEVQERTSDSKAKKIQCERKLNIFISFHFKLFIQGKKTFSSYGRKTALQCALLKRKRKTKRKN